MRASFGESNGDEILRPERFRKLMQPLRVAIGRFPTPVVHVPRLAPLLWIKRDDLTADPLGGNKVRALEFLLANLEPEEHVVTAGAYGSTHALATAALGRRLGARVTILHWPQEMNAEADQVRERTRRTAHRVHDVSGVAAAYAAGALARARGARWIPPGGSSPLGALGAVAGALEVAEQVRAGALPAPSLIVVPLGSGGTAAGLLVGLRLARLRAQIVAVRVVPRLVGNSWRVHRLARRTTRLVEQLTGTRVPPSEPDDLVIAHQAYGGAYGRVSPMALSAAQHYRQRTGGTLDTTYSAKAMAVALEFAATTPTLFWLTFDVRMISALP